MGIGIGVKCKYCGRQLTSLSSYEEESDKICNECKKIQHSKEIKDNS